ncbi:WD repeat-containing protein 5 [Penicillium diatomitis]|uniref:Mitochondrial division protein 1 n=1 Tax=Penicillium diatomitis TaxID=2819901 RepID=A0A9X0BY27_9EURO|nr:WD repeat-containing protein 5 [Penicillium diatomitis]KAJ5489431.1 WD repeat-containing protein 5 [Penicillium diatomitis]
MEEARPHPRRHSPRDQSPADIMSSATAPGAGQAEAESQRRSWSKSRERSASPQRGKHGRREDRKSGGSAELSGNTDEYWLDAQERRSPSPIDRNAGLSSNDQSDRGSHDEDGMDHDGKGRISEREGSLDNSSTPVPSVETRAKPERLNYKEKFVLRGHLRGVSAVQFSPDCSMIASGGADAAVKVWDTSSGRLIYTFEGHLAGISTIAWSPDGQWIASGSDDKTIRFWNVNTGNILVSGSYDEAVFVWDVRRARVMRSLPAHSDPVAGIDVVHDGTLIVSCALDGLVRVWDTHSGQCLKTLVHEDNPPATCVKFSPNGKYILAWTLDGCVRMWNYVESRVIKTFQGHVNNKYSLSGCFGDYGYHSSDADAAKRDPPLAFAVSGSEDGAILCWDIISKSVLQRIEGHTDVVLGVHTGKYNGKRLIVSCGLDKTVRVWEEEEEERDDAVEDPKANGTSLSAAHDSAPITGLALAPVNVIDHEAIADPDDGDNEMVDIPSEAASTTGTTPARAEDVEMT